MSHPVPGQTAPSLDVQTLTQPIWHLREQQPERFTMVVFYRGLHCPVCSQYLAELDRKLDQFSRRGVDVLAVSCDPEERAEQARREWGLERLDLGYGLSVETARAWGLYISQAIKEEETAQFCEPGLFLVRPDATLYYAAVNSMPFGRPQFDELIGAVDFVTKNDYPPRGES